MRSENINKKTVLTYAAFVFFALIAGASVDDLGVMLLIIVGVSVVAVIIALINDSMKKSTRKSMETSMTDFKITKRVFIENDYALYYDENQEKVRSATISASDTATEDFEGIKLGRVEVVSTLNNETLGASTAKFFLAENKKNDSIVLFSGKKKREVEDFSITNSVKPERSFFAIDDNREKLLVVNSFIDFKAVKYEDIIRVEIIEDGIAVSSKSAMRTIGGAVVGDVLAGGAGMVVGGLSGASKTTKEIKEIKVKLLLRDTNQPELVIIIYQGLLKTKSNQEKYAALMKSANQIKDIVSVIIDTIDKKANASQATPVQSSSSVADELSKLLKLKEQGILTEEEFAQQKAKLLNS